MISNWKILRIIDMKTAELQVTYDELEGYEPSQVMIESKMKILCQLRKEIIVSMSNAELRQYAIEKRSDDYALERNTEPSWIFGFRKRKRVQKRKRVKTKR